MEFAAPIWLNALWGVVAIGALQLVAIRRRRALLERLVSARLLPTVCVRAGALRLAAKALLALGALALLCVALAQPRWNALPQEVRRSGRDVVFVVDVSRSMLADDLRPNRLERAKIAISDVLRTGVTDRVGLVAFAGVAVTKAPLTVDTAFVRAQLDDLSPESVSRGGTLIGDALREAMRAFDDKSGSQKDIVLITDGEDQESFPVEAAAKAGEAGVRIIAVGLGDETTGRPIPVTDASGRRTNLKHNGEVVLSKLDGETLRKVASASKGGVYFNVATGAINLDEVYTQLVRKAEQRELEGRAATRLEEQFQLFLIGALALLAVEAMIGERSRS